MGKFRVIARMDVKNGNVIKTIQLEGLRKIGDPSEIAEKYYKDGIDEILFIDPVASLYNRNGLYHLIEKACEKIFVPITIGGGIRCIEDIELALKSGADKVAINTQGIKTPELIKEASRIFGSQCIVISVEAKSKGSNKWEAYIDNGREETGKDVIEWVKEVEDLGAGEILITSVDKEGMKKGFDLELIKQVSEAVMLPIIAGGGAGNLDHIKAVVDTGYTNAISLASVLHYNMNTVSEVKAHLNKKKVIARV